MIYLDYNATTPIHKEVAVAMQPFIDKHYGNPSSAHSLGQEAKKAVEKAREQVASLLGCSPKEIIFTNGGTESNNTVLKGVAYTYKEKGNHIIISAIEHPAVTNPCKFLEKNGYHVTYIPVDRYGEVNADDVKKAITKETILVSIMHANNEVGTIEPIGEIGEITKEKGILFHTDAAQSVGKIPTLVNEIKVDFLSIAGHKLYAPKGIGVLFIRNGISIEPLIHGAGHEQGRRAGTENVIFAAGLGKACELAQRNMQENIEHITQLRDYFYDKLKELFGDRLHLNGHPTSRLPNTLNVSFEGMVGGEIIKRLSDIAVSVGSACHAGEKSISPVLKAMGINEQIAMGAIRFSLGLPTTKEEIDQCIKKFELIVEPSQQSEVKNA